MTAASSTAAPDTTRPWVHYLVALTVALVMLAIGLGRFGIWQPSELRIADAARGDSAQTAQPGQAAPSRPPLQFALVRAGFHRFGPTEEGGRLPTALLAVLATMALAMAVGSTSDARTGMLTGVAYATTPLVFMNARQMFGGGVAQSTFTLFLAAGIYTLWGRPPPASREGKGEGPAITLWLYGRWALLGVFILAAMGAGWMLGVVPVLVGLGLAALLRWSGESLAGRVAGVVFSVVGLALGAAAVAVAVRTDHTAYSALTGFGPDSQAPGQLPTYDVLIEQIGHATFPWTGIMIFGVARMLMPPPVRWGTAPLGPEATHIEDNDAWREAGMRSGAVLAAIVAYALQGLAFQHYGPSAYVAAAPLAIAAAVTLRDAERDRLQWRLVTAGAVFITCIIVRDYALFPKSAYAALGLPDGGPAFPSGFTVNLGEWMHTHGGFLGLFGNVLGGEAPTEAYFVVYLIVFIFLALCPLFQGAGTIKLISASRPIAWIGEVEIAAREQLAEDFAPPQAGAATRVPWWAYAFNGNGILSLLRFWLVGGSIALMAVFGLVSLSSALNTVAKHICQGIAALPILVVAGTYAIIGLWDFFGWIGQPRGVLGRAIGSRVMLVPITALLLGLIIAQRYVPALSEHLSPRGVWAVLRQVRQPDEPVARFGGQMGDRATRYYANFEVRDIFAENDAVDWLRQTTPRHYLIVASDVFPSLNRAYRRTFPEGPGRQNVPVIDATNSNLYVAASDAHDRGSRNPLDSIVMSVDSDTGANQHWHPHGIWEGGHLTPQPAVFDNAIEYLGYNLDSNGMSYVPAGGTFRITYHFHVLREVSGNQQIFVHVDGQCPRINGDHEPAGGHYPIRYWLTGDYVHDEERITIPGYCRGGTYFVYIGFFQGDDRMRVEGGEHDRENRVVAARIIVR